MTSSHTSRNDVLAKIEKARQHVFALCKGDERWTMRVPANPERDSDLLICDALNAAEKFIQSETALISSLAMRCRPAVAHYMRTQERAAMSKALSPAAKEAAEKEAAWQGKLLDEIDNLIGARQVPPHRSGGGHG